MIKTGIDKFGQSVIGIYRMSRLAWKAQPWIVFALIIIQLCRGLFPVLTAWLSKSIFDMITLVVTGNESFSFTNVLMPLLIAQAFLIIAFGLLGNLSQFLTEELSRQLLLITQSLVYGHLNRLNGLVHFETPHFYDQINMATQGANYGPSQILAISMLLLSSMVSFVSFIGVLIWISPLLALLLLVSGTPHLLISLRLARHKLDIQLRNSPLQRRASYFTQLLSTSTFAKEVRLYGIGDYILSRLLNTQRDVQSQERIHSLRELRWDILTTTISQLVSVTALSFVVYQAFQQSITIGDVMLYTTAGISVQASIQQIILGIARLRETSLVFNYFTDLTHMQGDIQSPEQPQTIPDMKVGIELRNISFRYSDDHPWIFRNLNLFLPHGKCVALVGINGAGKTTLVKLLTRLYNPVEGQIMWDGIDIRAFKVETLRERIRVIFQDFAHYDLTAYENIGLGAVSAINDHDRIQHAAKQAGAHDFIKNLPQGYNTILSRWLVEEGVGVDLSGGQWQRIAIARMLMNTGDLLILDEPTAALDPQAEYDLYQRFRLIVSKSTSLLISHRFSTVRMADLIAVLEDGEITEYGSHDELILLNGKYAHLYQLQVEQYTVQQ
jgi:ATP-binding cassette subfamily B protein